MNTEQRFLRLGSIVVFAGATIGLAVSLALTVSAWLGWAVLAVAWLPVVKSFIEAERERAILDDRSSVVEPWVVEDEQV